MPVPDGTAISVGGARLTRGLLLTTDFQILLAQAQYFARSGTGRGIVPVTLCLLADAC